ncbi:v-SNARE protein VTI1 Ecym_2131 [Eremothecium cymbalariae DBVPG|uniref:t-SNARE coiled-coil homology domain-containing protein n=1 Tax=Eremothecium cymbalariae (strain CBS 270.75 / DBVPG 7215 / KCTC 17166 / NRRL Y-17582) TaxID=931890 RepID=G8JNG7_ERECY|nr:Hypothetical protein Ecym_2131 [Eremothecium cymbalariae DBVPG\
MSSLLNSYESDFRTTLQQTRRLLDQVGSEPLSQRNSTLKTIEQHKDDLFDIVDQMEVEINNVVNDVQVMARLKSQLREFKRDANTVKQLLEGFVESRDREELFSGMEQGLDDDQREQLLANHSILQRTGNRLVDAAQLANEAEGVGNQIMMDLRSQREALENSRQNLFQADSYVDKSIRTLKTMSRRLVANKFISYAIIGVLILLILLVLYSKFK